MLKIFDVIKYEGDNNTFIWKHPCEDFNTLTQLIVHESQEAVFFMNGEAMDTFGPGRHTLETQNIPLLSKMVPKISGKENPFHCEVYFINKTVQMAIKWGTDSRVRFLDPSTGIPLDIGASGELNLAVADSRKLLLKLVGTTKGIAWGENGDGFTKSIQNCFRPLISTAVKTNLANAIKSNAINLLEIDQHLGSLSATLHNSIIGGFEEYGLTVPQFFVTSIAFPENDPNFKKLRDLHTVTLQSKLFEAEAEIVAARRRVVTEQQLTETEVAKHSAERELIDAQTKAQAAKLKGFAAAEVMAAQGYNQKDVIAAEVQKAYAEGIGNMTITGGGGVAGDMIGLGVGMAAAGAVAPQLGTMLKGMTPTAAAESKCAKCGAALPANAKFCLECGEKVTSADTVTCPQCGKTVTKGKFCPECGYKFVTVCPVCGANVPAGARFCPECGEKL